MAKKMVMLHLYAKTGEWDEAGSTDVWDTDFRDFRNAKSCMKDRVWLGQKEIEIDFPEIDVISPQIEALEKQVQTERAESQSRVNLLLERISKLQCISFDADGVKL